VGANVDAWIYVLVSSGVHTLKLKRNPAVGLPGPAAETIIFRMPVEAGHAYWLGDDHDEVVLVDQARGIVLGCTGL